jgi:hypothetical protein
LNLAVRIQGSVSDVETSCTTLSCGRSSGSGSCARRAPSSRARLHRRAPGAQPAARRRLLTRLVLPPRTGGLRRHSPAAADRVASAAAQVYGAAQDHDPDDRIAWTLRHVERAPARGGRGPRRSARSPRPSARITHPGAALPG